MKKIVVSIVLVMLLGALPAVMAQEDAGQPVNFTGKIKSIEDGLIQVSLFTIDPTNAALGVVPEVGTRVTVVGTMQDGIVSATDIYPSGGEPASPTNFTGKIKSVEDGMIKVSVFTVMTGMADPGVELAEGMKVQVIGGLAADGVVYASSIQVQDAAAAETEAEADVAASGGLCQLAVTEPSANLRELPGVGAGVVGYAYAGEMYTVKEVHMAGEWGLIEAADGDAWIAFSVGELSGDCESLPVSEAAFVVPPAAE